MLDKVSLGKVWLSYNCKEYHKVQIFSQGPLKFTCAEKAYIMVVVKKVNSFKQCNTMWEMHVEIGCCNLALDIIKNLDNLEIMNIINLISFKVKLLIHCRKLNFTNFSFVSSSVRWAPVTGTSLTSTRLSHVGNLFRTLR